MIGFSPLPYNAPNNLPYPPSTNTNTNGSNKRSLASTREELESTWASVGPYSSSARAAVLHTISYNSTNDSDDDLLDTNDNNNRSFKRQRTNDSVDTSCNRGQLYHVTGVRINPDNRPPKSDIYMSDSDEDDDEHIKAGWYTGTLNTIGQRSGHGITKHDDGTEYDGSYRDDCMDGWGKYKFTTMKQLVQSTHHMQQQMMHRVTERSFEGIFVKGKTCGRGVLISTVIDTATNNSGECHAKVVYDCGYYREDGKAVGEGTRFTFTKVGQEWKEVCTRLWCGECSGVVTSREYGEWVCDCLGLDSYPMVPSL